MCCDLLMINEIFAVLLEVVMFSFDPAVDINTVADLMCILSLKNQRDNKSLTNLSFSLIEKTHSLSLS